MTGYIWLLNNLVRVDSTRAGDAALTFLLCRLHDCLAHQRRTSSSGHKNVVSFRVSISKIGVNRSKTFDAREGTRRYGQCVCVRVHVHMQGIACHRMVQRTIDGGEIGSDGELSEEIKQEGRRVEQQQAECESKSGWAVTYE